MQNIKQFIKQFRLTKRSSIEEITGDNKKDYDFKTISTTSGEDSKTVMLAFDNNQFLFIFDPSNLKYLTKGHNLRAQLDGSGWTFLVGCYSQVLVIQMTVPLRRLYLILIIFANSKFFYSVHVKKLIGRTIS